MHILAIGLGFQLALTLVLADSWTDKEERCLDLETPRANINKFCNFGPLLSIQANLIRLANTETCGGANVSDGSCICGVESQIITRELKKSIGDSGFHLPLQYFSVDHCVEQLGLPMLLRIEYECGMESSSKENNGPDAEDNGLGSSSTENDETDAEDNGLGQCQEEEDNDDEYKYESSELFHPMTTPNPTPVNITRDSTILKSVSEPVANADRVNMAPESTTLKSIQEPAIGGALVGVLAMIALVVAFIVILRNRKRSQPRSVYGGVEDMPMNGSGYFPAQPNNFDYCTCWGDTLAEQNTNSVYYEEIPATDAHVHDTTSRTRGAAVSGNGNNDVVQELSRINQGTIYETIDDANVYSSGKSQGEPTHTDSGTYDDVIEVMVCYAKTNDPVQATPEPNCDNTTPNENMQELITLMTAADETVLVDNCIYEGDDQE